MEKEIVVLNGLEFRLFHVVFNGEEVCVGEEKLNEYIEWCIEHDLYYGDVRAVDERFSYYVAQSVADTECEKEIVAELQFIVDYVDTDIIDEH